MSRELDEGDVVGLRSVLLVLTESVITDGCIDCAKLPLILSADNLMPVVQQLELPIAQCEEVIVRQAQLISSRRPVPIDELLEG